MADLTIHGNPLQQDVPYKLHDNGDGTYSLTTSSSGGGGGAVTVADGADVAQGTTTDASSASTVIGLLKNLKAALAGILSANVSQINGVTPLMGAGNTGTGSQRVTIASDQAAVATTATITATPSATATLVNVASSASSVTLIALNTARLGASIVNDSTAVLYVKYGSSASATSYNYVLAGSVGGVGSTWEMPANPRYTGIITGIWASATGSARTNELTV